jgi:hypothetical protein
MIPNALERTDKTSLSTDVRLRKHFSGFQTLVDNGFYKVGGMC